MREFIDIVESVGTVNADQIKQHMFTTISKHRHYERVFNGKIWISGSDSAHLMAEQWHADGTIPEVSTDSPEFLARLRMWTEARYNEVVSKLDAIPLRDGGYHVHRCLKVKPAWLFSLSAEKPITLGEYWTFNPNEWDFRSIWAIDTFEGTDVVVEAISPTTTVNWPHTIMANMDWYSGDHECELRLLRGSPLHVLNINTLEDFENFENTSRDYPLEGRHFIV